MTLDRTCPLTACKTCTGCAHDQHSACRRQVRCPTTGQTSQCRCCGAQPEETP